MSLDLFVLPCLCITERFSWLSVSSAVIFNFFGFVTTLPLAGRLPCPYPNLQLKLKLFIVTRHASVDEWLSQGHGDGNVHRNTESIFHWYAVCASDRVSPMVCEPQFTTLPSNLYVLCVYVCDFCICYPQMLPFIESSFQLSFGALTSLTCFVFLLSFWLPWIFLFYTFSLSHWNHV